MKLSETVELMNSDDWKDRLVAEYVQLQIRISKLEDALNDPTSAFSINGACICCSAKELAEEQKRAMEHYRKCLAERARLVGVDLHMYPIKQCNIK